MSMVGMQGAERTEQLQELLSILAAQIDSKPGARDMAGLAKQYRETLKELAELTGGGDESDGITELLEIRDATGKSRSVRPDRS